MAANPKAQTPIRPTDALRQGAADGLSAQDTLVNLVSGMGGEKDKLAGTVFGYSMLAQQQLDAAYRGDWISRKIVDIPAYDAFREWRSWQADKQDITAIEDLEKSLRVQRKAMLALQRGRLYGGGALILGVNQGTSADELKIDSLGKDCLKFVHVVSRFDLQAGPIVWDVMSPWFGEPEYYTRTGDGSAQPMKMHPSRVVRFIGHESADIRTAQGWGDSILQVCADAVIACGTVASSVAQLVAEAKVDVIKIPELSENLSDPVYEDRLKRRFSTANTVKSVFSMLIIDKEEEWERIQANFTGLPDILKMYLLIASGAADIPATRMLGQSPQGLSATGESDTRNYYDRVSTEQTVVVQPAMERLDKVIAISALGKYPEGLFYDWNPLWQMDPKDAATIAVQKATVMKADVDAALMDPMVLQKARENQLIEDGTYPGLEQIIEDHGTDITEREPSTEEQAAQLALEAQRANGGVVPPKPGAVPPGGKAPLKVIPGGKGKKVGKDAIQDMADRIAQMVDATTPRTLYVYRDLVNQDEVSAWFKKQGFHTTLTDMHVTIMYSKTPVDWLKAGDYWMGSNNDEGQLIVKAGGPRVMELFGKAAVMAFANTDLSYRHMSIKEGAGCSYDYPEFTPHVTITYALPDGIDILHVEAYPGEMIFGPEIFEEIKPDFNNERDVIEDKFNPDQPRDPKGTGTGGRFAKGPGQSAHLQDYMKMIAGVTPPTQLSKERFILENGKDYKFDAKSFEGPRDEQKMCYMNAGRIALNAADRTYVEGFVDYGGIPIQHAWTVDKSGKVFDTTLKFDDHIKGFYGVPFKTQYVADTALKTKVWGIISHTNMSLFKDKKTKFLADKYNPDQPRDPSGTGTGGQWTAGGSTPAQDLLALHHDDKTATMDDVEKAISPDMRTAMDAADKEMASMTPTNVKYLGPDGKYTAERAALHDKILNDMFSRDKIAHAIPRDGADPRLTLTGGRPAAGKTSSLKSVFDGKDSFYISADTIQESLPGYNGRHAGIYNGEAQDIALKAESIARKNRLNITYDATLKSTQPAIDRVKQYQAEGYKVDGYFVHTSPTTSAIRSVQRFQTSGRYVPPQVSFKSRTNEKTFDTLIPILNNWAIFDNNGDKPKKVSGGRNG